MTETFKTRRYCNRCQKLTWHERVTRARPWVRIVSLLLAVPTLGISFLFWYFDSKRARFQCGLCDGKTLARSTYRLKLTRPRKRSGDEEPHTSKSFGSSGCDLQQKNASGKAPIPQKALGKMTDDPAQIEKIKKRPSGWSRHSRIGHGTTRFTWEGVGVLPNGKPRAREAKQRDGRRCVMCGSDSDLETDHIIPLSKGGSNDFENLQTLCSNCHEIKTGRKFDTRP